MVSLEEPENSPVLRVEPSDSFEEREVVGPPGKVRVAKKETHPSDLRDVLVRSVERPDLVFGFFEVSVPANHVVNEKPLLLEKEQMDRAPAVRDLLPLRAFLLDNPVEEREIHIRSS